MRCRELSPPGFVAYVMYVAFTALQRLENGIWGRKSRRGPGGLWCGKAGEEKSSSESGTRGGWKKKTRRKGRASSLVFLQGQAKAHPQDFLQVEQGKTVDFQVGQFKRWKRSRRGLPDVGGSLFPYPGGGEFLIHLHGFQPGVFFGLMWVFGFEAVAEFLLVRVDVRQVGGDAASEPV